MDVAEIEKRIDRAITSTIPVNTNLGGIDPKDYGQVMEFAKTMSTCKAGIPQWLRGSPGDCLMICSRAMRWGMDPYFVAEKSYLMVNQRTNESRVAWESQLIHAVIEALAPLKGRLRHRYEGEGDDTICIVWGTFKGEDTPHEYTSVPLGKRVKDIGRSEKGNFRGSPLWLQKPRVQLFYDACRDWARINCPDVLAGVYTQDELVDMEPVDVTPSSNKVTELANRLRDANKTHAAGGGRGFDAEHVNREASARNSIIEGEIISDVAEQKEAKDERSNDEPVGERRADDDSRGGVRDRDEGRGGQGSGAIKAVRSELAGQEAESAPKQADLLAGDDDKSKGKGKKR